MQRRDFLKLAAFAPVVGAWPGFAAATGGQTPSSERIVVLIKLAGGNDGLNTLIPHADPLYYQARPSVGILRHQVLDIGQGMGMNPYMKVLKPYWDKGEMAWIQGVGYPHGDLSHFRSCDIWETAVDGSGYADEGWLAQVLPNYKQGLHGIVMGEGMGPMAGKDCHTVAMESPEVFLSQVSLVEDIHPVAVNNSVAHLTNIQHQLFAAGRQLDSRLRRPQALGVSFSTSEIGRKLESVANMILSGVDAAAYLVTLDGFDTHVNQLNTQSNLLHHLSGGLDSFARAMQRGGRWNDVLLVTYSEFGRRVQENHGQGTDHGTASVQLVMGGRVRGGMHGDRPRLNERDADGNLHNTVDFRAVYGTLAQHWWGQKNPWGQYGTLPFV